MFSFHDLTQTDVQNIMAGLMELPAKFANPVLQKLDIQFNIQVQAQNVKKPDPALDQGAGTDLTDTPTGPQTEEKDPNAGWPPVV
jgi:hypothetical protein